MHRRAVNAGRNRKSKLTQRPQSCLPRDMSEACTEPILCKAFCRGQKSLCRWCSECRVDTCQYRPGTNIRATHSPVPMNHWGAPWDSWRSIGIKIQACWRIGGLGLNQCRMPRTGLRSKPRMHPKGLEFRMRSWSVAPFTGLPLDIRNKLRAAGILLNIHNPLLRSE